MSRKKLSSVRQIGQLSLPSSFFQKPPTTSKSNEPEVSQSRNPAPKKTPISLSDFLNRKLDKDKPVSSAPCIGNHHIGKKKRRREIVDENVFQQFRHPRIERDDSDGLAGSSTVEELDARNTNPFHLSSSDKRSATSRHLLVIGDDPKPKSRRRGDAFVSHQTTKPLYNHYANGSGWWGCDREGIDNEEVGCSDAWEGMGATTNLGGLDWH